MSDGPVDRTNPHKQVQASKLYIKSSQSPPSPVSFPLTPPSSSLLSLVSLLLTNVFCHRSAVPSPPLSHQWRLFSRSPLHSHMANPPAGPLPAWAYSFTASAGPPTSFPCVMLIRFSPQSPLTMLRHIRSASPLLTNQAQRQSFLSRVTACLFLLGFVLALVTCPATLAGDAAANPHCQSLTVL